MLSWGCAHDSQTKKQHRALFFYMHAACATNLLLWTKNNHQLAESTDTLWEGEQAY